MYLFEYQAKELMRQAGISVLPGAVATTESRAVAAAGELGAGPWAVKAQVWLEAGRKDFLIMIDIYRESYLLKPPSR
jgi:succinyl-CoA synthetase beta subunit